MIFKFQIVNPLTKDSWILANCYHTKIIKVRIDKIDKQVRIILANKHDDSSLKNDRCFT